MCHQPKQYDISEMIKHTKKDIEYSLERRMAMPQRYEYEKLETLTGSTEKIYGRYKKK